MWTQPALLGVQVIGHVLFILGLLVAAVGGDEGEVDKQGLHVNLRKGTINGVHVSLVTLDYLTDFLGRPSKITDLLRETTQVPSMLNEVRFYESGVSVTMGSNDAIMAITFMVSGRNPDTISRNIGKTGRASNIFDALELLQEKLRETTEDSAVNYSRFKGEFSPELTFETKEKHLASVFKSPEVKRVKTHPEPGDMIVDSWTLKKEKHLLIIMFNAITHFVEFVVLATVDPNGH